MRVSTMLDSIFGVPKKLSIIFRGQQKNSGMDPPVLKVREYPPWDTKTTHKKNLQNLMVEIYKSMNHLNPEYMWDFFVKKDVPYNLRTKEICKLPSVSSQRYGINSLSFRGSLLWNALSDDLKLTTSLVKFKQEIRCWDGNICTCYICT